MTAASCATHRTTATTEVHSADTETTVAVADSVRVSDSVVVVIGDTVTRWRSRTVDRWHTRHDTVRIEVEQRQASSSEVKTRTATPATLIATAAAALAAGIMLARRSRR